MSKKIALGLILALALLPLSALADAGLKKVETKYVCMINDQVFDKVQIPVEVEGKTYYGCCAMCKERLAKDPESRKAVDPFSQKEVDKATAVIAADAEGTVKYFENDKNLEEFNKKKG